jgi:branched-chain amino acid transport system permease protein
MVLFVLTLVSGLTLGGTLALIALGLVLAFRATRVFNFAHGELLLLPAFMVGYFELHGVSFGYALLIAIGASPLVAVVFYWVILRRTAGLSLFMGIIATLGLASILDGVMGILFPTGQFAVTIPGIPTGHITIAGATISDSSLVYGGVAFGLALIVIAVIRFTQLGLSIRAAGLDPILASQCGLPIEKLHAGSWAVAGILATVAGIVYAGQSAASTQMVGLGIAALPAILLGGLDSVEGAVIGGLLVGLLQAFTQTYVGGPYVNLFTYSLLLIVMLVYPQGLFGSKQVIRA